MQAEAAQQVFYGYETSHSGPETGRMDAEFLHGVPCPGEKLLPDEITQIGTFGFLSGGERHFVGRIQARTYANLFGAVQTFLLDELPGSGERDRAVVAVATRCATDEASSRAMRFRHMEDLLARGMPRGYRCVPGFHKIVRSASGWAREAHALAVALFEQTHHRAFATPDDRLSTLFQDSLLRDRCDDSLHATIAEMALIARHNQMDADRRDAAVDGFINLIWAIDEGLRVQAQADARYFAMHNVRALDQESAEALAAAFHRAYRRQHLFAGIRHPRFFEVTESLVTEAQRARLDYALTALS